MSVLTPPAPPVMAAPAVQAARPLYRLSVAQYHAMARAGILTDKDRVELLDGLVVQKMTVNPLHRRAVRLLSKALEQHVPPGWYEDVQQPITLDESEPEPDGMVIRGSPDQYPDRHPGAHDVSLVVEVADSSLDEDRGPMKQIYAHAGIAVYWIVNLVADQVEVYTDPTGPGNAADYRQRRDYGPTESVPLVIDGVEVAGVPASELLP